MTANDIANMVEKEPYHTNLNRVTIANFIRQQQAEIEALKAKTLTDEEILIEAKYQPNLGYYLACEYDVLYFARAILRKAHER